MWLAISGASGAPYAYRLLQVLIKGGYSVYLSISGEGLAILNDEAGLMLKGSETDIQYALEKHLEAKEGQISYFDEGIKQLEMEHLRLFSQDALERQMRLD